mgnify:CR=1 FL=1
MTLNSLIVCVRVLLPVVEWQGEGIYLKEMRFSEAHYFSSRENALARFVIFNRPVIPPVDIRICLISRGYSELCQ